MKDNELIYYALCYWANYIETGDVARSGKDAEVMGKEVNALDIDQMKMVIRLRELAEEFYKRSATCCTAE